MQVQPLVSLAHKLDMSVQEVAEKAATFFKSLGADQVLEMRAAEDASLLEHQAEFVEMKRSEGDDKKSKKLPLLTSSCPGWVCYAEKTHGAWILPHISRVRSAQQILGAAVKGHMAAKAGKDPAKVCHVTLMPCFDKKLEASRADFVDSSTGVKDVDLVITTVELEQLLEEKLVELSSLPRTPLDSLFGGSAGIVRGNIGSGSGGYTESVFLHAVKELYGEEPSQPLCYKTIKNADFKELVFERDGKALLRFGVANGFRNIQNLVQKMKRKRCDFDFVEVMACPSGCLNGGAQCRSADGSASTRETVSALEELFAKLEKTRSGVGEDEAVQSLYREWLGGRDTDKAKSLLYTDYHEVEKLTNSLAIKW